MKEADNLNQAEVSLPTTQPDSQPGSPLREGDWVMDFTDHPVGASYSEHLAHTNRNHGPTGLRDDSGQQTEATPISVPSPTPKETNLNYDGVEDDETSSVGDKEGGDEGGNEGGEGGVDRGYSALSASMRSEQTISQFGEEDGHTNRTPPSPALAPVASVPVVTEIKESPKLGTSFPSAKSQCTWAPPLPPASACTKVTPGNPELIEENSTPDKPEEQNEDWTWTALGVLAVGAAMVVGKQMYTARK